MSISLINKRNRSENIYIYRRAESHLSAAKVTPTIEPAAVHPANKACSEACSLSAHLGSFVLRPGSLGSFSLLLRVSNLHGAAAAPGIPAEHPVCAGRRDNLLNLEYFGMSFAF